MNGLSQSLHPSLFTPPAKRAGDFLFLGSHTAYRHALGRPVLGTADLIPESAAAIRSKILFSEVAFGQLRAQARQVLENLSATLEAHGSSIRHVAHIRIFLSDIGHEGAVLSIVRDFFGGSLPSGEIVEAKNSGVDPDVLVQMDCVALLLAAGQPQHVWVDGLEKLSSPFPTATKAGPFLFSSQFAGADMESGEAAESVKQLSSRARALVEPLLGAASLRHRRFLIQQGALWETFFKILESIDADPKTILYHMNWMRPSMRVFIDGSVTRRIMDKTGDYLLTCFPVSGLRTPDAQLEGKIISILPGSGMTKDVRLPIHGISNSYFGMIGVGGYLFGAGEVPIDTTNWRLIDSLTQLPEPLRHLPAGKVYRESPISSQAHYIYSLWSDALGAYSTTFEDAVHQSVYLVDASDGPAFEAVMLGRFPLGSPATTFVPIVGASPSSGTRLELEMIAYSSRT